ncbi:type I-C CRISPR-associated protein Cas8c/Csd1 [bacterium]|nr:type I-C CRISPR-associated protein Cas8c/Csd1 [bacterium]
MMLQALIAYAERENLGDPDFEATSIHWLISISSDGKLSGDPTPLYDDPEAKKPQPKKLLRAFTSPNELNQGDKSHFLADSLERAVLMPNPKAPEKAEGRRAQHTYFKKLLSEAAAAAPSATGKLAALLSFLGNETEIARLHASLVSSKAKPTDNAAFEISGEKLLEDSSLKSFWRARRAVLRSSSIRRQRVCLASGRLTAALDTTEKIKGVPGGLATGTNLISFDKDSFTSYGLEQAQNAAISADSELKFRSALNTLIPRGLRINDAVHLHWTREATPTDLIALLASADEADVKNLFTAAQTGLPQADLQHNAYYAMSLSGNGARIVVRDWLESTVPEVEDHVRRWFNDITIVAPDGVREENAFKLGRLLYAMVRDKIDELPPQIPTQLLYAALRGTPLPQTALVAALRRQQIENKGPGDTSDPRLNPARMALIRACLNRSPASSNHQSARPPMTTALDPDSRHPAYLCGRLFAVFDRLQYLALEGVNAGVVERFYASASVTPALVMGRLHRNAQFHLAKAGGGVAENVRKDFEEISSALGAKFPVSLDLEAQGRFALGYYHQKADYRRRTAERKEAAAAANSVST